MQYIIKKARIVFNYSLSIIFLFFGIIKSSGQPGSCQGLLESLNGKKPFPTEKEADYLRCLSTIETEYGKTIQKNRDISKDIEKWNSDLRRKNSELERARQNNDTINVTKFTLEAEQITKDLNTSKEKLDTNSLQMTAYKKILSASYSRMINYFEEEKENSAQAKPYRDKLDNLNKPN